VSFIRPVSEILLPLPDWLLHTPPTEPDSNAGPEARMRYVLELVRANLEHGTGGPFAAAVFDLDSGRLLASGVNLVVPSCCSSAHAEIVALSRAQQTLGDFDLGAGGRRCELVSSTEPCAMCLGAIPWSGISALVCGATDADARATGFDEGDKPDDWSAKLRRRGIAVTREVCRQDSAALLQRYADSGAPVYNPRSALPADAGGISDEGGRQ
jgi:tRNA(Arg) A34 adenosine deaminase TadA